ncbi:MAG TPA: cation-transporting P-type ATPase, partial [Burkholderiaceae bacterium]|nr:cation-transporting P-type ATPase [Burkholderiaceae bacterium]
MPDADQYIAQDTPWHAMATDAVLSRLGTDKHRGLSEDEVRHRLTRFGLNRLPPPHKRAWWLRILLQFHNVLIYVMIGAAAITASLGHWIDTG